MQKNHLEQWYLSLAIVIVAFVVAVLVGSFFLGRSPADILVWCGHLVVYLLGMLVLQLALPVLIGLFVRRFPLEWLDNSFGRKPSERISGFLNFVCAMVTGVAVAVVWVWLTPIVGQLPSFSDWPVDWLRWPADREFINWTAAGTSFVFAAIGYFVGLLMADELHKNDEE